MVYDPTFNIYKSPRTAVFRIDSDIYGKEGWIQKEELALVIGENDVYFIESLYESSQVVWNGDDPVLYRYQLPKGFHKSRLVRWIPQQLSIF